MDEKQHDDAGEGLTAYCRGVAGACALRFRSFTIRFLLGSGPEGSSVSVRLYGEHGTECTHERDIKELELYIPSAAMVSDHDVSVLDARLKASERAFSAGAHAVVDRTNPL